MKLAHARRTGRRGFTLVELMVVIAIISVLVSLISAAVWKAVVVANRVRNSNEISQLAVAVENFKVKFTVYPPSRILLGEQITDYFRDGELKSQPYSQFHAESYAILMTIFPRLDFRSANKTLNGKWLGIDWDGNKTPSPPVILEGDQCLVFFLGGIPQVDDIGRPFCSGFSTNPGNPAAHVLAGGDTIAPFFDFQSTRLLKVPRAAGFIVIDVTGSQPLPPVSTGHHSYRDTYGNVPYAYFSSNKARNGYNRYLPPNPIKILLSKGGPSTDCTSLRVWPYAESPVHTTSSIVTTRYLNPNTFQIISAGADGKFGQGTVPDNLNAIWNPVVAGNTQAHWNYSQTPIDREAGLDDQSNFYDAPLGVPSK